MLRDVLIRDSRQKGEQINWANGELKYRYSPLGKARFRGGDLGRKGTLQRGKAGDAGIAWCRRVACRGVGHKALRRGWAVPGIPFVLPLYVIKNDALSLESSP